MLDINFIRENVEQLKKAINDKQLVETIDLGELLKVDEERREFISKLDNLRAERNRVTEEISKAGDKARKKLIEQASEIKTQIQKLEEDLKPVEKKFSSLMEWVPNIPADDVPVGPDESGNVVVRQEGTKPKFSFEPKDHVELGESLGIIDIERGVKIGGFRSYFLVGQGMLIEQAILKYSLDYMVKQGFIPMSVPVMVNKEWLFGTGYFPWGEEDHYTTQDTQGLVGTSEVSLTSYYANEVLDEKDFPILLTGLSPCFRREVGSYGKDTKGVFRVHQFNKVEQVVLLPADEDLSRDWHEKMLGFSEQLLKDLGLHYQVVLMCTGDMGAGQRKKYDIETWFPAQNKYRETHSDSYFLDFQARRLNIRYRDKTGNMQYAYTLNNTVAATPRLMAAILEHYQEEDGGVRVPKALVPYTGFERIG